MTVHVDNTITRLVGIGEGVCWTDEGLPRGHPSTVNIDHSESFVLWQILDRANVFDKSLVQ